MTLDEHTLDFVVVHGYEFEGAEPFETGMPSVNYVEINHDGTLYHITPGFGGEGLCINAVGRDKLDILGPHEGLIGTRIGTIYIHPRDKEGEA